MKRNILIDGNNLLHRINAIVSKDPVRVSKDGYPINLIVGTLSILLNWIHNIPNPDRLILFLDGTPKKRLEIDPNYKPTSTTRPGSESRPLLLASGYQAQNELDIIVYLLKLVGFDVYYHPEEEADDLIASFVFQNPEDINIIISSDKDFYHLFTINPKIILYIPGIKGNRFFDRELAEADLLRKYKVKLSVADLRMFKALTGDPSDGIKGVLRLRKKVVAPICHCQTVNELYETGFPNFSKTELVSMNSAKDLIEKNLKLISFDYQINLNDICQSMKGIRAETLSFSIADSILNQLDIRTISMNDFKIQKTIVRFNDVIPDFLSDI
jgi:5'-3' exonuclease